jgi:hypothetical protein
LLPIQMRELEPDERIFEATPDPLNRVQLGTRGRQEYQAYVFRQGEPLGCRRPAVIPEQEMQAVAEGLREGVDEELKHLGIQIGQFQEEPVTRVGPHGPVDGESLEDVLDRPDGLHPSGGETPSADGEQPEAALILAEDMDGAHIGGRDGPLQVARTASLEGWNRFRVVLCDSGVAL